MITYLYWITVLGLAGLLLGWLGAGLRQWRVGLTVAAIVLVTGWLAYYFHFQQVFVKHWGGVMHISVPAGQQHISATWKDDHLWVENYDPKDNTCIFTEYSKGNLLEGKVIIRNCNPRGVQP